MTANDETHPADRPWEPEHPMSLEGGHAVGDPLLMLRCLCEEYLMHGTSPDELRRMTRDAGFGAFAMVRHVVGVEPAEAVVEETIARIGHHRIRAREVRPVPPCLGGSNEGGGD